MLYNPEDVYECISEEVYEGSVAFKMKARDKETEPVEFILSVAPDHIPEKIEYSDINGSSIIIYIINFKNNINISEAHFNFTIPADVDVIEMP